MYVSKLVTCAERPRQKDPVSKGRQVKQLSQPQAFQAGSEPKGPLLDLRKYNFFKAIIFPAKPTYSIWSLDSELLLQKNLRFWKKEEKDESKWVWIKSGVRVPVPEKWCDVEYPKPQLQFQLLLLTLTLAGGAMEGVEFEGLGVAVR